MSLFCDRCTSGHYHVTWTGPYHVIVPATEMTGKVLRKMTINHNVEAPQGGGGGGGLFSLDP